MTHGPGRRIWWETRGFPYAIGRARPACMLLLCFALCIPAFLPVHAGEADKRNIRFSHLSVDDGLSQASVMAVVQDAHGFIWIGTQEGLNRYDGDNVHVYQHDPDNPGSLPQNFVTDLLVSQDQDLWIATASGKLSTYNYELEQFERIELQPNSLPNPFRIKVIYQDRSGRYWLGSDGAGLVMFTDPDGPIQKYRHDKHNPASLPGDTVLEIFEDSRGTLWIGTEDGGMARLDPRTNSFVRYQHDPAEETSLSDNSVQVIYEDGSGTLWVGTQHGLNRLDRLTGGFDRFLAERKNSYSLQDGYIRAILEDKEGTLWIGTEGGLHEWRPRLPGFISYQKNDADLTSLNDDRITVLLQDDGGVLWVGGYSGLNLWNYSSDAFNYLTFAKGYLAGNIVTALAESTTGDYWIGTYGTGLSRVNLAKGETRHYRNNPRDNNTLSDDRVMSVYVDHDGIVWAGTRAGGLSRLDPESGTMTHYRHPQLASNAISALSGDPDGTLWVGTFGGGLNRINPDGTIDHFAYDTQNPASIGGDRILTIYRDHSANLWVGAEGGGLNLFDDKSGTFERILPVIESQRAAIETPWQILESRDGSLWLGTRGGGLNRWTRENRKAGNAVFSHYGTADGLPSDTIYGILEDPQGILWLSSNHGVTRLDPDTSQLRHFDKRNGLKNDEFNLASKLLSRSGMLLFGGKDGVLIFDPSEVRTNQHVPPVVIDAFARDTKLATSYSTAAPNQPVILDYRDYYAAFDFSALDYFSSDKNTFRYKLEGFDPEWRDAHGFRRATYTNIPSGNYRFSVQAANSDGVWNEAGAYLDLIVVPPPWQSNWAYAGYSAVVIILLLLLTRRQQQKSTLQIAQRHELESQVQSRTRELAERNSQLEKLNGKLQEASVTDSLTGLHNRRYLYEIINTHTSMVQRGSQDQQSHAVLPAWSQQSLLFFMMIDLDGFKAINDAHGHLAGDTALLQVRDALLACCRQSDTVIRWGGDEFLVVGHSLGIEGMSRLAERIRRGLSARDYQVAPGQVSHLSGSIGVAPYPFAPQNTNIANWEQVVNIADRAAYVAKTNGRDGWVALHGNSNTLRTDPASVQANLAELVVNGRIELLTSIPGDLSLETTGRNAA